MGTVQKNKGGRPKITLDAEQIAQVEALGAVLSVEQISNYFGFDKTTFYRLCERQPEVMQRYKKGKAKAIYDIGTSLLSQARKGNTAAMMFYLKTQAGWRETEKDGGNEEAPAPIKINIQVEDARINAESN